MSSVYTGVGSNVTQSTSPTITVPADGDSLAVTSVNTPMDKLMDYIALLFGGAQTGQATGTPGYAGTGGATAQGLKATAGGGGSPAKGALNLVPQVAPSAPADGDIWVETTTNVVKARINGVTVQLAPLFPMVYSFGGIGGTTLSSATDYYCPIGRRDPATIFSGGGATVESPAYLYVMPFAGKLGTIRLSSLSGSQTFTFKIVKNAAVAATLPTWNPGASYANQTYDASAISVAAGDRLGMIINTNTGATNVNIGVEIPVFPT